MDAHHAEVARCRRERVPPPPADVARWRADGWAPVEPLHARYSPTSPPRGTRDAAVDGLAVLSSTGPTAGTGGPSSSTGASSPPFHQLRTIEAEEQAASARTLGGRDE